MGKRGGWGQSAWSQVAWATQAQLLCASIGDDNLSQGGKTNLLFPALFLPIKTH